MTAERPQAAPVCDRYAWTVIFDQSGDGYLGVSQNTDRVLLSPAQVRALLAFVRASA
jgi:hypothetical protein